MLSDPKWNKKVEVELDEVSQHILRAVDYIIQHGWCQNELASNDGRVCLQGALIETDPNNSVIAPQRTIAFLDANRRIRRAIGNGLYSHDWNDVPIRTKEDVIAKLREAAYLGK